MEITKNLWPSNVFTAKSGGDYKSYLEPKNQEMFDKLFSDFIGSFGTHYIESAKMGAVMRIDKEIRY